ncbi:oxidoreductase [Actinosynnema sp. ALI-1.44]|uniref:FAD-dependent monooxygenase n=1 Tax=Actinosynnema sp. ALI-1.44 TaxID=1933779 RepID=UPI00097BD6D2|nr:FAD-dependent monooxygenase [Actinosynnema sp. ALI-1.44]ONI90821.1 oxidoreductase [Actinosynnema sp. ALI-1.44]
MTVRRVDTDVVVVGAGPVGLLLAGELRLGGVTVVVVERLSAPTGESRASQLNTRTVEIFDQRGLLERLGETRREDVGHFGGLPLDMSRLRSVHAGHWKVPQYRTEAMLGAWASDLGADIRRGHELRELAAGPDRVDAEADGPDGPVGLCAKYLVGCDGEQSAVRLLAGFDFPGTEATRELLRTDVAGIDIPNRRFQRCENGLAIAARRSDDVTRVMVHEFGRPVRPRTGTPQFAEVVDAWARTTGEDISGGRPIWVDAFGDASRQVTHYRRDRVLLAGDAAHRQMPVGGQALNLGLQDAVNLGWKLAAQVRGWAPAGLLDSYHDERHPVGARVLTNVEAQTILLLGGSEVDAVRTVFGELLDGPEARGHLAGMVSGLDVRYQVGPGEHPLLGARLPDCELTTEFGRTTTTLLLRSARGLLLDLSNDSNRQAGLHPAAMKWSDRIRTVRARAAPDSALSGAAAVLVRPDGHIAWTDDSEADMQAALYRWFGAPAADTEDSPTGTRKK